MSMPDEEYDKTEAKQWIEKKKYKGKLYFFGKNSLHEGESEVKVIPGDIVKEKEKSKGKQTAREGKWRRRGKKNTMQ